MKIKCNIVILFTHFFVKQTKTKKPKKLNLCRPSSGHSINLLMTLRPTHDTDGRFHVKGPRKKANVEKWIFLMTCER